MSNMQENKTILITGATGNLGSKIAIEFARKKNNFIFPVRVLEEGEKLAERCYEAGSGSVHIIQTDLTSPASLNEIRLALEKYHIFPGVLVNNARNISYLKTDNGYTKREDWIGEFMLDVVVPYELTMLIASQVNAKLKKVINIASIYGVVAPNISLYNDDKVFSPINYGVAKAGLIHLTKELAVRLASREIEVNSISYGGVEGRVNDEFKERYGRLCPSGKMLEIDQIFGPVEFLSSEKSNGITGHNVLVDGGWTLW